MKIKVGVKTKRPFRGKGFCFLQVGATELFFAEDALYGFEHFVAVCFVGFEVAAFRPFVPRVHGDEFRFLVVFVGPFFCFAEGVLEVFGRGIFHVRNFLREARVVVPSNRNVAEVGDFARAAPWFLVSACLYLSDALAVRTVFSLIMRKATPTTDVSRIF